ncbi:hypothetical protein Tco_1238871 [Tanacetum coccineum]
MPSFLSPEPTVSYSDYLDFLEDFENEFPAIVYNDALTSKSDSSTAPEPYGVSLGLGYDVLIPVQHVCLIVFLHCNHCITGSIYLRKGQKRSQNDKTEHENGKSVKQKSKSKVNQSQPHKSQRIFVQDSMEHGMQWKAMGMENRYMVTLVDGVLANGVVMIFEMDIAFYAIHRRESCNYDSDSGHSFDNPLDFLYPPPQPQYVPYSCELCGNDAHYGYNYPPQVPFVYDQDPCFNQNFDYFPQTSPSFPQQYPCCEDCGGTS